jgi:hypothetical protein
MLKRLIALALVASTPLYAQVNRCSACSVMDVGPGASLHGYTPSPNDLWHLDVSGIPTDVNSTEILTHHFGATHMHADFGSCIDNNQSCVNGMASGIPYVVVDGGSLVNVPPQLYVTDSDITPAPVPQNLPIEGWPSDCPTDDGDRHAIVIDKSTGVDYEYWQMARCRGQFTASNNAVWDFTLPDGEQRPFGYTSVDAAGMSVFEGLIRYDEIQAGVINHATRYTTNHSRCDHYRSGDCMGAFIPPASHAAGNISDPLAPVMGMRLRLKADFDISRFSPTNQIILTAWKKYGLINADNGGSGFFQGSPDARWDDEDLIKLGSIPMSNFEVLEIGQVYTSDNPPSTGKAPVLNSFTSSAMTIMKGQSITLKPNVTGQSYMYIENAGFTRGQAITVTPTETTTYTLVAGSNYLTDNTDSSGNELRPTQSLTIKVIQQAPKTKDKAAPTSSSSMSVQPKLLLHV